MNREEGQVRFKLFGFLRLLPFLKPYLGGIVAMVVVGCITSLGDAAFPLFNRYALDHFVIGRTLQGVPGFIAMYISVLVVQVILNYVSVFHCGKVEMIVDRDLRNAAFNHP